MNKRFNLTLVVTAAATALLLAFDAAICWLKGKRQTISVQITKWSSVFPAIPFALGFLMGHLFGQDDIDFTKPGAV